MNSAEQQTDALKGQGPRFDKELRQLREPAQVSAFPGLLCSSHPHPPQVPFSCLKKSHLPGATLPPPGLPAGFRVPKLPASCILTGEADLTWVSGPRSRCLPSQRLSLDFGKGRLWAHIWTGLSKLWLPWQTEKHMGSFQKPNRLPLMGKQAKELSDRRRS